MKFSLKILSLIVLVTQLSFSQWTTNTTMNTKVCKALSDQKYPEMVSDGAGGTIIVWQDDRDSDTKIYAQRLDAAGIAQWTDNGILISTATGSKQPQLTSDGAGGAIITWFDLRYGWPNSTVSVQRVNANGDTLWQANGIPLALQANSWSYPVINGYGVNGAVAAWIGIDGEIYSQKIDTSGSIKWKEGGVLVDNSGGEPRIIVDDAGGAIITWFSYDPNSQATTTNIFAQRVNVDGLIQWTVSDTICDAPDFQQHPCLVPDGNGGAIISWIDSRQGDTSFIYAQRVSASGVPAWGKNGIRITDVNSYYRSYIASDDDGGAIITWLGKGYVGDVHVQRINGDGTREWPADVRLTFDTNPSIPEILADGFGGAFVCWSRANQLLMQHLNPEGASSYAVEGEIVSNGDNGKDFQSMCTDGNGSVMFSWEDTRPVYTTDIYAHRITVPGLVTEATEDNMGSIPADFSVSQNYPNPFNPSTTISYSVPKSSFVSLRIFNSLGEEIKNLIDEEKAAGTYKLIWNASDLPSGVYFYQMHAGSFNDTKKMILMK